MSKSLDSDQSMNEMYAMFWRMIHFAVHRYGSHPTGQLLVVLSIILLERAGATPTVSEVAEATGLPKSSVSRYVSTNISAGFLEEAIDPQDRRRRYLKATAQARKERKWHTAQLGDAAERIQKAISGLGSGEDTGADMLALLKQITRETQS
jgi:DNA-binding MarR family transcriptional regulator